MPKFFIRHLTQYQYQDYAQYSANRLLLYPIRDQYQDVMVHQLDITNNPVVSTHTDYFGNQAGTFTLIEPHLTLTIDSQLEVVTLAREKPGDQMDISQQWNMLLPGTLSGVVGDFLEVEQFGKKKDVLDVFHTLFRQTDSPLTNTLRFNEYVYTAFTYIKGVTTVESTADEIWEHKSGVCQDFAHILLEFLRMANIPARYVSGYICPHQNGMRGEGATHAWVEAYLPAYGWLGVDPTNNCLANETHVRLAVGRNFSDCSPVKGTYRGGAEHSLHVSVTVSYEDGINVSDQSELASIKTDKEREIEYRQSQQ